MQYYHLLQISKQIRYVKYDPLNSDFITCENMLMCNDLFCLSTDDEG